MTKRFLGHDEPFPVTEMTVKSAVKTAMLGQFQSPAAAASAT